MHVWHALPSPTHETLHDLWGEPGGPLFVIGESGTCCRSEDGGLTWEAVETGVKHTLRQFAGTAERLWVVGHTPQGSVVLETRDGRRFKRLKVGRRPYLRTMAAFGEQLVVAGTQHVLRSEDGGKRFDVAHDSPSSVQALWGHASGRLFAIGYDKIAVTTDGGSTFRRLPNDAQAHLSAMDGTPDGQLWAVGYFDILRSRDGGERWERVVGEDHGLGAIDVLVCGADDIVVVGAHGRILGSGDGESFEEERRGGGRLLRVQRVGSAVYAVGEGGVVLRREEPAAGSASAAWVRTSSKSAPASAIRTSAWSVPQKDEKSAARIASALAERPNADWLFLDVGEISDLSALATAHHLRRLTLWGAVKADLSPLAALPALEELTLGSTRSLAALPDFPALRSLQLGGTAPDLGPLTRCAHLEVLDLSECRKVDISPLAGLRRLEALRLPRCVEELSPLGESLSVGHLGLKTGPGALVGSSVQIGSLRMEAPQLASLEGIEAAASLTGLDVVGGPSLFDLSPLCALTSLERFELSGGSVTDLTPLASLTGLTGLKLEGQQLDDLRPLSALSRLEWLNLDGNGRLASLDGVQHLTMLRRLHLTHTRVSDLTPVASLTTLDHLGLADTRAEDLSPISGLTALTSLDLSRTRVASVRPLRGLTALRTLHLDKTRVHDLRPLADLTALELLNLAGLGEVEGQEALSNMVALGWLNVEGTTFDTSVLAGLPCLRHVRGCLWPPPGAHLVGPPPSPPTDALGPGLVFDGRLGSAVVTGGTLHDVALSPDGRHVAVTLRSQTASDPALFVFGTERAELVAQLGRGELVEGVTFDTTGRFLFYSSRTGSSTNALDLWRVSLAGGRPEPLLTVTRRVSSRLAASPDGQHLALITSEVDVVDIASGTIARTFVPAAGYDTAVAVFGSQPGDLWVWSLRAGEIVCVDALSGQERAAVEAPYETGQALTIDRTGRTLVAVAHNSYGVAVWDLERRTRLWPERFQLRQHVPAAVISADGTVVVELSSPLLRAHRIGADLPALEGPPALLGGIHHTFAAATAQQAPMVAFGLGSWRSREQRVIWVPLVEAPPGR